MTISGLSLEEQHTHTVTNLSGAEPAASKCYASTEQDLLELRSTNPAAMTPVQVLNIPQQYD